MYLVSSKARGSLSLPFPKEYETFRTNSTYHLQVFDSLSELNFRITCARDTHNLDSQISA